MNPVCPTKFDSLLRVIVSTSTNTESPAICVDGARLDIRWTAPASVLHCIVAFVLRITSSCSAGLTPEAAACKAWRQRLRASMRIV